MNHTEGHGGGGGRENGSGSTEMNYTEGEEGRVEGQEWNSETGWI